jgi:hypothetical protein
VSLARWRNEPTIESGSRYCHAGGAILGRVTLAVRVVSTALLVVLIGLPVAESTCAIVCSSSTHATGPTHHGVHDGGTLNHGSAWSAAAVHLARTTVHECRTHDGTVRQTPSTAADRADDRYRPAPAAIDWIDARVTPRSSARREAVAQRPPGLDSPPRPLLVLRV